MVSFKNAFNTSRFKFSAVEFWMMCDITRKPLFCNYIGLSKVSNKRTYDDIKNLPVSYDVVLYEMLPLDHKRSSVDQHYTRDKVFIYVKSNF